MDWLISFALAADQAAQTTRSPFTYSMATYLWVIAISSIGGTVSFINKVKRGAARPFNIAELLGEIFSSGFVGLLTFWACEFAKFDPLITAVLVGITGHMGTRALFAGEHMVEQWFYKKLGITPPCQEIQPQQPGGN